MGETVMGLTVVKQFTYRGDGTEEWSNKYFLTGPPPDDEISWQQAFDDLCSHELHLYTPSSAIMAGYGYNDNDEHAHAVWSVDYRGTAGVPGDLTLTGAEHKVAGDQAAMIEWRTSRKNSRGKWVYLRKYIHDVSANTALPDETSVSFRQVAETYATRMMDGSLLGGRRLRSRTHDEVLTAAIVPDFITTRTLKRRGKRP
jgi:hypothetical protein